MKTFGLLFLVFAVVYCNESGKDRKKHPGETNSNNSSGTGFYSEKCDSVMDHLMISPPKREPMEEMENQCKADFCVTDEMLKQVEKGTDDGSAGVQCYFKCISNKFGTMDNNGNWNFGPIQHLMKPGGWKEVHICLERYKGVTDCCEKAYKTYVCFNKAFPCKGQDDKIE